MNRTILARHRTKVALAAMGSVGLTYYNFPDVTTYSAAGIAASAIVWAGYWTTSRLVEIPHMWSWITPLHRALAGPKVLNLPDDVKPRKYIKIARGYQKREEVGKIYLPVEFTGVDVSTPTTVVRARLGLTDVTIHYRLAGRKPHMIIKQTPRPPQKCVFADHMSVVAAASESAPLIGLGPLSRHVSVDLDAESPHILVSASTGGGKSVITRTMAAQMLHNGAQMVVLDFKRHSQKWSSNLPQVRYCREISEIHDVLVALGQMGHDRNMVMDDWPDDSDPDVGPRMGILLEEANATIVKLKRYWKRIRKAKADEFGPADPVESPAIDALREVLFMGRAVKMHVLLVAQSATANALGGPEVRECFATRILARYTQNAWKMLVPEVHPIPRSTRHIGRAQVVLGGVASETQVLFMSPQEATQWASSGIVAPAPSLSRHAVTHPHVPTLTSENARDVTSGVTPHLALVKTPERRYNLAEASREGVVPLSADALRQAKRRPGFPQAGDDGKWTAVELQEWFRSRPSQSA